jgi:hypothetical protein
MWWRRHVPTNPSGKYIPYGGGVGKFHTNPGGKYAMSDLVKVSTAPASSSATMTNQSPTAVNDSDFAAQAKFLRLAHDGGCKGFSTVIGPEANDVHRTHLHLDLQERKTSVCE